jgi:hypothetical protein
MKTNNGKWKQWFASDAAAGARSTLKAGAEIGAPALNKQTSDEVKKILQVSDKTSLTQGTGNDDAWQHLLSLNLSDLRKCVATELEELRRNQSDLDRRRQHGWRKITTGFQDFVITFDKFLEGYSGVVEIVKEADARYGGAATAMLAVLFAVSLPNHQLCTLTHTPSLKDNKVEG